MRVGGNCDKFLRPFYLVILGDAIWSNLTNANPGKQKPHECESGQPLYVAPVPASRYSLISAHISRYVSSYALPRSHTSAKSCVTEKSSRAISRRVPALTRSATTAS